MSLDFLVGIISEGKYVKLCCSKCSVGNSDILGNYTILDRETIERLEKYC